jgi:glutamyl-tRNA reductase
MRQAELRRVQARLGHLTPEQTAAVEALSRGLMNKFLHAPMQALKQAARDEDAARVEAIRATFALEPDAIAETLLAQFEADVAEPATAEKVRS